MTQCSHRLKDPTASQFPLYDAPVIRTFSDFEFKPLYLPFQIHIRSCFGSFTVALSSATTLSILDLVPDTYVTVSQ